MGIISKAVSGSNKTGPGLNGANAGFGTEQNRGFTEPSLYRCSCGDGNAEIYERPMILVALKVKLINV